LQIGLFERDGQTRPVTMFAAVIEAIKQITRYAGAELDAAVVTSFITAVIETEDGDSDLLGDMGTPANPTVGLQGGPATASDERQIHLAPAATIGLRKGEKLASFNPNRPNSGFEAFFRAWCSIIGAAIGLPHELLIKHFTSSYSASRGAMIEAWREFKTKRSLVLVDQFAQPVYTWLISEAVARGYLSAPGFFTSPLVKLAYLECSWSGPIMGQLNPLDEANAAIKRVDAGFSTIEEETAELTGGDDWERKHEQRVKEHTLRVAGGLEPEVLNVTTRGAIAEGNPTNTPKQDANDAAEKQSAPEKTTPSAPPSTPPSNGK
jgi:lambda family phage portal protein